MEFTLARGREEGKGAMGPGGEGVQVPHPPTLLKRDTVGGRRASGSMATGGGHSPA